ncbi:MAG: 16S rRNA (cytosine(1402)-N(4))-methyltransferase RsmH [Clostridia bacterium]|nr:16S rRNA (cytosine(1402)-N(4))-methyltransferase RsmH [Clostridia bacterium]
MNFSHYSVLLGESVDALSPEKGGTYADLTLGGGGHSLEILKRMNKNGRLIAFDQDKDAIAASKLRLCDYIDRVTFVNENFSNFASVLDDLGIDAIDGAVIDLGVSSYQLDTPERGFSYMHDAPLDMRMNKDASMSAYDVVNTYTTDTLKKIIYEYGEEKFAPRIAAKITAARQSKPIETTFELVDIIRSAMPDGGRGGEKHPAKRTFQAIRIEVNKELDVIKPAIYAVVDALKPGGRLAVITFHSLEDRLVKNLFAELARPCTCPPDFPVCVCGKKPTVKPVTHKPVLPSAHELEENSRSRSAKLRIIEKI